MLLCTRKSSLPPGQHLETSEQSFFKELQQWQSILKDEALIKMTENGQIHKSMLTFAGGPTAPMYGKGLRDVTEFEWVSKEDI